MKQYLDLLKAIQERGTDKPAARANMPGTRSLFGYQFRHDLADGFPLLTTKKMHWKGIVTELLWFLRGDTNIKYLVDHGVNIWNEDAYSYYKKIACANGGTDQNSILKQNEYGYSMLKFDEFVAAIAGASEDTHPMPKWKDYMLGDCGFQYGRVWREWQGDSFQYTHEGESGNFSTLKIDQIAKAINRLKNTPESRRHLVTAIDPAHDEDLALYWCHAMFQFNCRPLTQDQKQDWIDTVFAEKETYPTLDSPLVPKYALDCQLYQRSADSILGVPYNIASYALLTMMLAQMVNMVPGDFIHSFGDAHIYDNHKEAVAEQLSRTPTRLPILLINENVDWVKLGETLDFESLYHTDFVIGDYHPQPSIKAELKTGL